MRAGSLGQAKLHMGEESTEMWRKASHNMGLSPEQRAELVRLRNSFLQAQVTTPLPKLYHLWTLMAAHVDPSP